LTIDALLAAAAVLSGVLLKGVLDLFGALGSRRLERKRLQDTARREAYTELLITVGQYNSAAGRLTSHVSLEGPGFSETERAGSRNARITLENARDAARDSLQRSVVAAQLVSSEDVKNALDAFASSIGTSSTISVQSAMEPLRKALTK
jgi:hypothetical protein